MTPLLAQFITESRDQIEQIGQGLLAMEHDPQDHARVNEVFRAAHTIKGSSGLFEFPAITRLVHGAEDLLDALRNQELNFTPEMMDLLLESFDHVLAWLMDIEQHEQLAPDCDVIAHDLASRLRAFLPENAGNAASESAAGENLGFDLSWMGMIPDAERRAIYDQLQETGGQLVVFRYTPDAQCFFTGDDPFFLVLQVEGLAALHIEVTEPWPALAELDAYRCVLRFFGITTGTLSALKERFRYVPDQVQIVQAAPVVLAVPSGIPNGGPVYDDFIVSAQDYVARNEWEGLRRITATLLGLTNPDLWIAAALRWLQAFASTVQPDAAAINYLLAAIAARQGPDWYAWSVANAPAPEEKNTAESTAPLVTAIALQRPLTAEEQTALQTILRQQSRILSLPVEPDLWLGRVNSIRTVALNVLRFAARDNEIEGVEEACATALETHSLEALRIVIERLAGQDSTPVVDEKPTAKTEDVAERDKDKGIAKILKVDQNKIDQLMDLIGELIVAKNSLPYLAQRAENIFGNRELAREIKDQYAVINRIAQEMQGRIMQVRMMPVVNIFQRFPRLVRDLSRKLDKQVQLVIEGEDTEADKNVIEALADPLIHILRNSLDHGIELPEDRLAAGKTPLGTIRVSARQDNENVLIEVSDDGHGIDSSAVLRKAVERGLIDESRAATLTADEAIQLIFAPGLSTAATISDVSGRGVGMDVVRASVERLGGTVKLTSQFGIGTTLKLALPLSMAVTQVMGAMVDGRLIGIPIDLMRETVRLPQSQIHTIKNRAAFLLRGQLVPLIRMRELLELEPDDCTEEGELAVLVVNLEGELIGLVVDQFREKTEILLKPLDGMLATLTSYSGTALLGDGSIMLILNLKELF